MPQRTKKENKKGRNSGQTGSRWHNFHFSGKLISCSVIFGFLLILVGGILLAIGMDRDEESKSDDYGDLPKKPPLVFVGPVIMGIGGFTVVVGVIMCLVETKVFRRRGGDANPLINSESGESASRNNGGINGESGPSTIPSDSKHHRKHRHGKRSPNKAGHGKNFHSPKSHSSIEASPSSSQSSEPIGISGKGSRNFLNASDTFLTPPGSFVQDELQMKGGKRDAVNQTNASLIKSFNSSGTYSTEFQTPSASFIDEPSFPSSREESIELPNPYPLPGNLNAKALENARHQFLTPQNSNADILEPSEKFKELRPDKENSPIVNRHAFLTPKNSADLLEESPSDEETERYLGNSSYDYISKGLPGKVTSVSVVADVHEPSKLNISDMNNASVQPSTNHAKHQEVEHSHIKVDVLIDAIHDEVKGNTHASAPNSKDEETGMSSEYVAEASNLTEENELKYRSDSGNANSLQLTPGDNITTDDLTSNKDMDSRIYNDIDSLNNDK